MGARKVVEPGNMRNSYFFLSSEAKVHVANEHAGNERWIESTGGDCSEDDVAVYQGDTSPLPNGIPTYTVQILNKCVSGCAIADIHVSCQWFSSARAINPRVFRRLDFDDCLVNDGAPIPPGSSISFQYANSFRYPLAVSSLNCSRK